MHISNLLMKQQQKDTHEGRSGRLLSNANQRTSRTTLV